MNWSCCQNLKFSCQNHGFRICLASWKWRWCDQLACVCPCWPVDLFDLCSVHSLICLVMFWSLTHSCWLEGGYMYLGWEYRLLLFHNEWLCVCVTASDSPRLCEQHRSKVSCLCLQIDIILAQCQNLLHSHVFHPFYCFPAISILLLYNSVLVCVTFLHCGLATAIRDTLISHRASTAT